MSKPVLTVDSIAVISTIIILTYLVILLLNKKKPCVYKIGKNWLHTLDIMIWSNSFRLALLTLPVRWCPDVPGLWGSVPQLPAQRVHMHLPPVQYRPRPQPHVLCYPRQDQEDLHHFHKGSKGRPQLHDGFWKLLELSQVSWVGGHA